MNILKKVAVAAAAMSMVAAPVAASAQAPQFDDLRVDSEVSNGAAFMGGSSWLVGLLAGIAIIGAVIIFSDGSDDSPTSP